MRLEGNKIENKKCQRKSRKSKADSLKRTRKLINL